MKSFWSTFLLPGRGGNPRAMGLLLVLDIGFLIWCWKHNDYGLCVFFGFSIGRISELLSPRQSSI